MEDGTLTQPRSGDSVDHGTVVPVRKTRPENDGNHKRSISGGILGSLPFLRATARDTQPPRSVLEKAQGDPAQEPATDDTPKRGSSLTNALRQSQGRKRKGSLRRLATGKMMRERRNSILNQQRINPQPPTLSPQPIMGIDADPDATTPRQFTYENPALNSSSDSGWPPASRHLSPTSPSSYGDDGDGHDRGNHHSTPRILAPPVQSPVGPYASTTDDDESLSFFRPTASSSTSSYNAGPRQAPGPSSLQRRRSNRSGQNSSLTIVHTPSDVALDDEWDYSETEWWGWVVLIVTWVVFVVGMGSCLGVWSWAWDVGETPYAPPELEDDATLPITGYYPALMLCTAVMAWVWVVVAWVGMKYFRHAKVVGEDS